MAIHEMHRYFGRYHATPVVKLTVLLLGLIVVGYIAAALVGHARALQNVVSASAPASGMSNPNASTGSAEKQPGSGIATAAPPAATVTAATQRDFDYFPDHYVNQATKIEEPIPTF